MKHVVELKADGKTWGREIRHLHFLVKKFAPNQQEVNEIDDEVQEEVISEYIPCESYRDLQCVDKKLLENATFFSNAVCYVQLRSIGEFFVLKLGL